MGREKSRGGGKGWIFKRINVNRKKTVREEQRNIMRCEYASWVRWEIQWGWGNVGTAASCEYCAPHCSTHTANDVLVRLWSWWRKETVNRPVAVNWKTVCPHTKIVRQNIIWTKSTTFKIKFGIYKSFIQSLQKMLYKKTIYTFTNLNTGC
jgi:hypothetical protein